MVDLSSGCWLSNFCGSLGTLVQGRLVWFDVCVTWRTTVCFFYGVTGADVWRCLSASDLRNAYCIMVLLRPTCNLLGCFCVAPRIGKELLVNGMVYSLVVYWLW